MRFGKKGLPAGGSPEAGGRNSAFLGDNGVNPSANGCVRQMNSAMEQDREVIAYSRDSAERSDEDLLLEYRASGDREAFEQLVRRYERELYNYLRQYLGDAQMAEDAFQTTFLQEMYG